jgi:fructokinase
MNAPQRLFAGVELGGTKCICLLAGDPEEILAQVSIPTGSDAAFTLARISEQLGAWRAAYGRIDALGIASFGPIDRNPASRTYGYITSTGKPGWRFVDVAGPLQRAVGELTSFDTDVNGAALAEHYWGAAQRLRDSAYVTVGTGVGVGLIVNGALVHGFAHPELGHARVAGLPITTRSACALHTDCVEGYASGKGIALQARMPAEHVGANDPVWNHVAYVIGQLLHNLVLTTAPRRIVIGGGVMSSRPELLVLIRQALLTSLNGYIALETLAGPIEDYIVPPGLGLQAGPLGALALAIDVHRGAVPCDDTRP